MIKERTYQRLTSEQITELESRGCTSTDWSGVYVTSATDLRCIRNVEFVGEVKTGALDTSVREDCGLHTVLLKDCELGDNVRIRYVTGGIDNIKIGDEVTIENVGRIVCEPHARCGIGTHVAVLDETGSREVVLYPGLSAQEALLMARASRLSAEDIYSQTEELIDNIPERAEIGDRARITDSGLLKNVSVGRECVIEGASRLTNGTLVNNAGEGRGMTFVGAGVDADNFIIEDGIVDSGVIIRNCYIGQGARVANGFTAHDSLIFANSTLENGEACAVFAGPYTVSMHKGTLLIGCQTSFMNAGSSTNQSNHMYKLGPVHWGVLERGVKTSSNSYLMLGANIGAFSLLMGDHKTHPDSREFPFSYLFGDPTGATVVVPAVMLRSCGLLRDEKKWPSRDRRRRRGMAMHDRVVFDVLNPVTVDAMIEAIDTVRELLQRPADDDRYIRYKGMKVSRASLERAIKLYTLGVMKYLSMTLLPEDAVGDEGWEFPSAPTDAERAATDGESWIDLAGQPMPRRYLKAALEAESVAERSRIFDEAYEEYDKLQRRWIAARMPEQLRVTAKYIREAASEFDHIVEQDRETYRNKLSGEQTMLQL